MKSFEDIITDICENKDDYDINKLKKIYDIISPVCFTDTRQIISVFNKLIEIFWKDNLKDKEIFFIKNILSYLYIIIELDNNFTDIDLEINFFKYRNISPKIYMEIKSYKDKFKNNMQEELYYELWNKFLNFENPVIIKRLKEYYSEDFTDINRKIINEYMRINNLKFLNINISDHVTLFFLLILDKI
jgi:hypothetical protein